MEPTPPMPALTIVWERPVAASSWPCNRDRLRTRVKAWEDGAWVRDAAMAHAVKSHGHAESAQLRQDLNGFIETIQA